jgi:hypothetical protein
VLQLAQLGQPVLPVGRRGELEGQVLQGGGGLGQLGWAGRGAGADPELGGGLCGLPEQLAERQIGLARLAGGRLAGAARGAGRSGLVG